MFKDFGDQSELIITLLALQLVCTPGNQCVYQVYFIYSDANMYLSDSVMYTSNLASIVHVQVLCTRPWPVTRVYYRKSVQLPYGLYTHHLDWMT